MIPKLASKSSDQFIAPTLKWHRWVMEFDWSVLFSNCRIMGWEGRAEILVRVAFRNKLHCWRPIRSQGFPFFFFFLFSMFWYNNSLTTNSGVNATCPPPVPKSNFTECNDGRQVCLSGVGIGAFVELHECVQPQIRQALSLKNSFWGYAAFCATLTDGSG